MANQYGVDLGEVFRTGEAVKSARQARKHAAQKMEWEQEDRDTTKREKAEQREAARQRANMLTMLRSKASSGDKYAVQQLAAFDPTEAESLLKTVSALEERDREALQREVDMAGRMAAYVLNSPDQEGAYQKMLANIPEEARAKMPPRFDVNYMKMQLAKAQNLDDALKNPELIKFGEEDRLYKHGQKVESAKSAQKDGGKGGEGGKGGGVSTASMSEMRRQTAALFSDKAYYNPISGELIITDKSGIIQAQIQSILREAARLMEVGKATNEADAVTKAAGKSGFKNLDDLSEIEEGKSYNRMKFDQETGTFK